MNGTEDVTVACAATKQGLILLGTENPHNNLIPIFTDQQRQPVQFHSDATITGNIEYLRNKVILRYSQADAPGR